MRFNFKKIASVLASAVMLGSTAGFALAANYPNPMVVSGTADAAVVVTSGSHAGAVSDWDAAVDVQSALQGLVTTTTSTTGDVTTGEIISLDSSSSRIYLNTSLNTAKTVLTKTDLPNVLGAYTFSGNVDAKLTSTITFGAGTVTGADNSGKVIFAKQPKTSDDPVIGISLGSDQGTYLYNASFTSKAINFSHSDSHGETIKLFGKDFIISTKTVEAADDLVLFGSAEQITLTAGGASANPSITTTIDGTEYTVELVSGSDTTATVEVNGASKEISEGDSKKIEGLEVAIKSVDESEALGIITCTLLLGSEKITLTHTSQVTKGSDDDPVDGTYVFMTGTDGRRVEDLTELRVSVYRPTSSEDAIVAGDTWIDPVFGSFKVEIVGLSSDLDNENREIMSIGVAGDDTLTLTMGDSDGNEATFDWAHNKSGEITNSNIRLADDNNKSIWVKEMANLSEDEYIVVGNEEYGHLLQVTQIYNNSGEDVSKDKVTFKDVISGETFSTDMLATEGTGTLSVDGKAYTVTFDENGDYGWATIKYPTSDSDDANTMVLYPSIQTKNGANLALVDVVEVDLGDFDGNGNAIGTISVPDGDGYSDFTFAWGGVDGTSGEGNWTITGGADTIYIGNISEEKCTAATPSYQANTTIGDIGYFFNTESCEANATLIGIYSVSPSLNSANLTIWAQYRPGILLWEEKDDKNEYKAVYVDVEPNTAGTSSDGIGVNDVLFSSDTKWSATLASDSDIEKEVDWWGTAVTTDSGDSDQKIVTISYPKEQVYTKIYIGEETASVAGGTTTAGGGGTILVVKDSEVSSVSGNNLIVVGGSCINKAAAEVLGVSYPTCSADFTAATNVGAGQYLIKSVQSPYNSAKTAVLVAGYEAEQTKLAVAKLKESHATDEGTSNIYPVGASA